ncbi:MAG: hypothetical protein GY696_07380 [Gammaproteobacteria bacterium]|nr:hypothetical protein [Gammaproteobacteria bacterium]
MIRAESGSFSTFTGHRIAEVKAAKEEACWLWVPTDHIIAELGTKMAAKPEDLEEGSLYQRGPEWLCQQEKCWPTRADFNDVVPDGELKKVKLHKSEESSVKVKLLQPS